MRYGRRSLVVWVYAMHSSPYRPGVLACIWSDGITKPSLLNEHYLVVIRFYRYIWRIGKNLWNAKQSHQRSRTNSDGGLHSAHTRKQWVDWHGCESNMKINVLSMGIRVYCKLLFRTHTIRAVAARSTSAHSRIVSILPMCVTPPPIQVLCHFV